MKEYSKPTAIIADGLSEGVFAASGAAEDVAALEETKQTIWGDENGQITYRLSINKSYIGKNMAIYIKFNHAISGSWGGNLNHKYSGDTLILTPGYPNKLESDYEFVVQSANAASLKAKSITGEEVLTD